MSVVRWARLACLAAIAHFLSGGSAFALGWPDDSRVREFIIQPVLADVDRRVATAGEFLIVQPLSTPSYARLEEPLTVSGLGGSETLAAGTLMFSAATNGWFCAPRDGDAVCVWGPHGTAYSMSRCSDGGFGVPIVAFRCGKFKTMSKPVSLARFATGDVVPAMSTGFAIGVQPEKSRQGSAEGVRTILVTTSIQARTRWKQLNPAQRVALSTDGTPTTINVHGAEIEIFSVTPEGDVDYRIVRPMPKQRFEIDFTLVN